MPCFQRAMSQCEFWLQLRQLFDSGYNRRCNIVTHVSFLQRLKTIWGGYARLLGRLRSWWTGICDGLALLLLGFFAWQFSLSAELYTRWTDQ